MSAPLERQRRRRRRKRAAAILLARAELPPAQLDLFELGHPMGRAAKAFLQSYWAKDGPPPKVKLVRP